jgi:hypothetical protein
MSTAAHLHDGRWRIRLKGYPDVTTDELTLDDVEIAEKVAGVPWVLLNPLASAKEAKAFLTLTLMRAGVTEDEALKAASKTPLSDLASAFTFEMANRQPATTSIIGKGEADPPSSAATSVTG